MLRSVRYTDYAIIHLSYDEMMMRICLCVASGDFSMSLLHWIGCADTYIFTHWHILEAAASSGNMDLMSKWIHPCCSLSLKRTTILYIKAVRHGQTAVCDLLRNSNAVDKTPDLSCSLSPHDSTYLFPSDGGSNHLVVKWLLSRNYLSCWILFTSAASVSDIQTLDLILDNDVLRQAFGGQVHNLQHAQEVAASTLHDIAVFSSQPKVVTWLLSNGFAPNLDRLLFAIHKRNLSVLECYLKYFGKNVWKAEYTILFRICFPEKTSFLSDNNLL